MTSLRRLTIRALSAAAVCFVLIAVVAQPAVADEPFNVETFSNRTIDTGANPYTAAGGHPDRNITAFSFPTKLAEPTFPTESPRRHLRRVAAGVHRQSRRRPLLPVLKDACVAI